MVKYAQIVMGPAGSGKSTYCHLMQEHLRSCKRNCFVVNFDPAADHFNYDATIDIRELIQLEDVMEDDELKFGPNGGLVFCMEYVMKNLDWLRENLDAMDDDYILFDCPGQIELYTHLPAMRTLADTLQGWDFRLCGVFLVDAQFLGEPSKFVSGVLASLSCMVNLEISHVSLMSKIDLLPRSSKRKLQRYLDPEMLTLSEEEVSCGGARRKKFEKLTATICQLIDDYGMVRFMPLDRSDEESIDIILQTIDMALQYGEDAEVQTRDFDDGPHPGDDG